MLEYLSIGSVVFPSYPISILLSVWVGTWLAGKEADRLGIGRDHIYNITSYGLLVALIGGRAWYVLHHWDAYVSNLWQAFIPALNAIALPEALFLAGGTTIIYCRRNALSLRPMADIIACGLAIGLIIISFGAFLGSRHLGAMTEVPWAIEQLGDTRHPVYLYHLLILLPIFTLTWRMRTQLPWPSFNFLRFTALYAGSWLIIDPFFSWSPISKQGFHLVQVGALLIMLISLSCMAYFDLNQSQA